MSYAEAYLPLPCHAALWQANSPEAWQQLYTSRPDLNSPPQSVADLLRNTQQYTIASPSFDKVMVTSAVLSAAWGFVGEYRQQAIVSKNVPMSWNPGSLVHSSRQSEFKILLDRLRPGCPDDASLNIYHEVLGLHLHVSLEDIKILAGTEGLDEARGAYARLREFSKTPAARDALWHAGQIVRFARRIRHIRAFEAIAVYHAALTMWAHGVVTSIDAKTRSGFVPPPNTEDDFVLLDGDDLEAMERFISLYRGQPAISCGPRGGIAELAKLGTVMEALVAVFVRTHKGTELKPALVVNLIRLVREMKNAAREVCG
ncbi:MAG: hypothetical protein MMC23_006647 [Stictis urceolatum]|nr:hypothetical protein [Stictis urceolata]